MKQSVRSRALDYLAYLSIGLLIVGFIVFSSFAFSDPQLGSQLVTAFITGCILVAFIVADYWGHSPRKMLIAYCATITMIHFAAYIVAFKVLGPTKSILAGLLTPVELGLFWWAAGKIVPDGETGAGPR